VLVVSSAAWPRPSAQ